MSLVLGLMAVVATYFILKHLLSCNHEWVAPADHSYPIFCRKCYSQGIGWSMPNDRVPAATVEEEEALREFQCGNRSY